MNSFDLLILIIAVVANLVLGSIVLLRNRHAIEGQVFLIFTLAVSSWAVTNYFTDHASTLTAERIMDHLAYGSVFAAASLMLGFIYIFIRPHISSTRRLLYSVVVLAGTLVGCSDLVVGPALPRAGGGVNDQLGPLFYPFVLSLVVFLVLMIVAVWRASRSPQTNLRLQQQLKFITLGFTVSFIFGLAIGAIIPAISSDWNLSKFGPIVTVFMVGSITYAIVRHRLFDIRLVVARSIAYALLLTTLGFAYALSLVVISSIFFTGVRVGASEQAVYLVLALVLALTFQPLRRFFEHITDRIFFRDHYDSQTVLSEFSNVLVHEIDLSRLLKDSLQSICQALSIGYGQLFIFNEGKVYRVEHYGPSPTHLLVAHELKLFDKTMIVSDELEESKLKDVFDDHDLRLSAMLRSHDEVVGYLLLGDKLSGDIYSTQDIEIIGIMAKELAVAVSNAKAYAEIQDFAATLQERVNHATGRLRVANRHLKELDQAKDEFLSLASHQLRTPLTTIKGYLSMVLDGDAGKLNKAQHEFTQNAFESSERMVRLISDLLDVSRMAAGRFVIERKATDANEMMKSEVQQLQSSAANKGLHLSLVMPAAPLPPVMLDENKTRQVLMNLIDNAIHYTDEGSVTVLLSVKANRLHVEVRDTGIGVPEAAQVHLFSKFFRAGNAQKSRPDGTGLGLFLVKRVIEDQGGSIIFSSTVGKGSIFGFELPLVPVRAAAGKAKAKVKA